MVETTKNISQLRVMFSDKTVFIEKEDWAYHFITLIADFGGVLGLFIGFNFLMIWDIFVNLFGKIKTKWTYSR